MTITCIGNNLIAVSSNGLHASTPQLTASETCVIHHSSSLHHLRIVVITNFHLIYSKASFFFIYNANHTSAPNSKQNGKRTQL